MCFNGLIESPCYRGFIALRIWQLVELEIQSSTSGKLCVRVCVRHRWTGKCWYYYNQLKYEFDLEFEVRKSINCVGRDW